MNRTMPLTNHSRLSLVGLCLRRAPEATDVVASVITEATSRWEARASPLAPAQEEAPPSIGMAMQVAAHDRYLARAAGRSPVERVRVTKIAIVAGYGGHRREAC